MINLFYMEYAAVFVLFVTIIAFSHINEKFKKIFPPVELPRNLKVVFKWITIVYRAVYFCYGGLYFVCIFQINDVHFQMCYLLFLLALGALLELVAEYFKLYLRFKQLKERERNNNTEEVEETK